MNQPLQQLQQPHFVPTSTRQEPATQEFTALARHLANAQRRCSDLISEQAREIAELKAQAMRMRAVIVARESALAWAVQDRQALEQATPGLAARATLTRQVKELRQRLQDLMRDALLPSIGAPMSAPALSHLTPAPQQTAPMPFGDRADQPEQTPMLSELEASVAAADLVICQTGCLSHGAYWRVQDHCKRTGKTCMLVAQPATFRVVRIHQQATSERDAPTLALATTGADSKAQ